MQRPPRHPQSIGGGDADDRPRSLLRRLREDPTDAVNRIALEIGARRPTSLGEAQAAAYLDGRMRRAGLRVSAQEATPGPAGPVTLVAWRLINPRGFIWDSKGVLYVSLAGLLALAMYATHVPQGSL